MGIRYCWNVDLPRLWKSWSYNDVDGLGVGSRMVDLSGVTRGFSLHEVAHEYSVENNDVTAMMRECSISPRVNH